MSKQKESKIFEEYRYVINEDDKTITITGFDKALTIADIPPKVDGYPVANIHLKESNHVIKELVVPEGVTIDSQSFFGSSLEKVMLKSGVLLKYGAFEFCNFLTDVVMEPGVRIDKEPVLYRVERNQSPSQSLMFVDYPLSEQPNAPRAWRECFEEGLTTNDLLKEGMEFQQMHNGSIFSDCTALTEIIIPEGTEILPSAMFSSCSSLCRIQLPTSLRVIGSLCFGWCKNLVNVVIPEGVVAIGEEAFTHCEKLETVVLPSTLTHIVGNPFNKCKSLKSIVVPEGMKGIQITEELPDEWYRNLSFFNVECSHFNKDEFFADKSWKDIFKTKAKILMTYEAPDPAQLYAQEEAAIAYLKEQGAFDKLREEVDGVLEYFLDQLPKARYKRKDIKELKKQILLYMDMMQTISRESFGQQEAILEQVKILVEYINDFEQQFQMIETEDRESICMLIDRCAVLAGYPFPEEDPCFDITSPWRDW